MVKHENFTTTNPYSGQTIKAKVPTKKNIKGKVYELFDIFPNWGFMKPSGHSTAKNYAETLKSQGIDTRVIARSGYTIVYGRKRGLR